MFYPLLLIGLYRTRSTKQWIKHWSTLSWRNSRSCVKINSNESELNQQNVIWNALKLVMLPALQLPQPVNKKYTLQQQKMSLAIYNLVTAVTMQCKLFLPVLHQHEQFLYVWTLTNKTWLSYSFHPLLSILGNCIGKEVTEIKMVASLIT